MNTGMQSEACARAVDSVRSFLDGELEPSESIVLLQHITTCAPCREEFDSRKEVYDLLDQAYQAKRISDGFDTTATRRLQACRTDMAERESAEYPHVNTPNRRGAKLNTYSDSERSINPNPFANTEAPPEPSFLEAQTQRFGNIPWWVISGSFHLLMMGVIALLGVALLRHHPEKLIMLTELKRPPKPLQPKVNLPDQAQALPKIKRDFLQEPIFQETVAERPGLADVETEDQVHAAEASGAQGLKDLVYGDIGSVANIGLAGSRRSSAFGRPLSQGGRLRRALKGGGSEQTEAAVEAALGWLARHQRKDGAWQRHGIKQAMPLAIHTEAVTALALLAFLGAGHSENIGEYQEHVRRAVKYLIAHQSRSGIIGRTGYTHAIAGLALSEAAALGDSAETRAAAQRVISFTTERHQRGTRALRGGWRYDPQKAGDLSVTGWFVMQLKSGKEAMLHIPPASWEGAARFLDSVEKIQGQGDLAIRTYGYQEPGHGARTTPIGLLCRQFMGWPAHRLQTSVKHFVDEDGLPVWDAGGKSVDLYRWYYATLCLFQQGGDEWHAWNGAMKKALLGHQNRNNAQAKDGSLQDFYGSWDPVGIKYAAAWERVGQTALAALCLEVYYRYLPLYR